jgi:lysyl endopeptidase
MSRVLRSVALLLTVAALASGANARAQSNGWAPMPVAKAAGRVELVVPHAELPALSVAFPPIDATEIASARAANSRAQAKRVQVGIERSTFGLPGTESADLPWREIGGRLVARWEVVTPGAEALRIQLAAARIPEGVELRFAGSDDPDTVYGPMSALDFRDGARPWSPVLRGEAALIEVVAPRDMRPGDLALTVSRISHLFANPLEPEVAFRAKTTGSCSTDFICRAATDAALATVGKAVARMVFQDGGSFRCTGTLLNPTDGSPAPYFYSASHCIHTQAAADTLATFWFYDSTACVSPAHGVVNPGAFQIFAGATLLYSDTNSDVSFMRLNETPPAGSVRAGWDATALGVGTALTAVHHPAGDLKAVSLGTVGGFQNGIVGGPSGSFVISNWTNGVTEGGSSGSGIFTGTSSTQYKLRGGLWGGPSACGASASLFDYYSRLDLAYPSIKQWIDPPSVGPSLAVTKAGAGTGTVTSAPAGIACGATCSAGFPVNSSVTLTAVANSGSAFSGWSGACLGTAPCVVTMGAAQAVTATFTTTAQPRLIDISVPNGGSFGGQSMGTTSPPLSVRVVNVGANPVTFGAINTSDGQFAASTTCVTLAPGAACSVDVTFAPVVLPGPVGASAPANSTLTIASNAAGTPAVIPLAGTAEKSLVSHYYRSILRRPPDAQGFQFWTSEAQRVAALGLNVNEAWYAIAMAFYGSAEYASLNRTDAEFVADLYRTFFNRAPDASGLSFWAQDLANGLPRGVALAGFMFSNEYTSFAQAIFGNTAVRPEIDAVTDFYRGLLSRLPDAAGFAYWLQRFRAAQCQGPAAVLAEADAISAAFANGAEYSARARTNSQFVGDLYNAFLRRGGDIGGAQFWTNQLLTLSKTRDGERAEFVATTEFAARVAAVGAAGCFP